MSGRSIHLVALSLTTLSFVKGFTILVVSIANHCTLIECTLYSGRSMEFGRQSLSINPNDASEPHLIKLETRLV